MLRRWRERKRGRGRGHREATSTDTHGGETVGEKNSKGKINMWVTPLARPRWRVGFCLDAADCQFLMVDKRSRGLFSDFHPLFMTSVYQGFRWNMWILGKICRNISHGLTLPPTFILFNFLSLLPLKTKEEKLQW